MQLIVLDLEWNQPTSYQSAAYRRVGDRLLFEVIQFGAAKLDEGLEIVDKIAAVKTSEWDRPVEDVMIKRVRVAK